MLFNSLEFLLLFLPLVLLGFQLLQRSGRGRLSVAWLTLASLFFYGWWNPVYVLLILLSMAVNFSTGQWLARNGGHRTLLIVGIVFNLGLLGYFKYFNFFIDNLNLALQTSFHFEKIVLPLAISFYTFQQITYLVDSHKGLTASHSLLEYSLFVTFFPQLIAGPIVHHSDMLDQFRALRDSPLQRRNLQIGLSILVIGLFKKVFVADGFAHFAIPVFDSGTAFNSLDILVGVFAYTFQLYFDFSGYSDMAIGLACLFGIRLPVNFFSPYRARNIGDFWRMWHATLSRFLRDYVYTPMGGFVCSRSRQRINLFTTMFCGGVWHGAGWTFIVFGLLHGSFVVLQQLWRIHLASPLELVTSRPYQMAMQAFTFLSVVFTLVFFRSATVEGALGLLAGLGNWQGAALSADYQQALLSSKWIAILDLVGAMHWATTLSLTLLALALAACWCLPNTFQLFEQEEVMLTNPRAGRPAPIGLKWEPNTGWALWIGILLALAAMNLTEVSEFLYFQF